MLGQLSKNTSKKAKKSRTKTSLSQDASAPYDYPSPQQSSAQTHPANTMIGFGVTNRANINQPRWNSSHQVHRWNFHHYAQVFTSTRPLLGGHIEDFMRPQNNYIDFMEPSGSSSQNSDPTATSGELDLELRLCSTPPEPSVE